MMPSVVATAVRTDYEAGPEDHRKDENDPGNNHDPRGECKDPTGSAAAGPSPTAALRQLPTHCVVEVES